MTSLVIVESPNKVRSIAGYLGDGYVVDSSVGHIRDLPRGADEVPAAFKGETWARLGVNIDSAFEPIYVVSADKKSQMTKLKKLLKEADELVLATDEDREGEAIAWHLLDELKPKVPVKRIVFNEITKDAIQYAIAHPRDVDMDLVDAQETRRILDRLYGYEVSPVLWKKVMSGLSAGRVQSVATRLVVERERERMAFRIASYWDLEATFDAGEGYDPRQFPAKLFSVDGKRIASGNNFDNTGQLTSDKVAHLDEQQAGALAEALTDRRVDAGAAGMVNHVAAYDGSVVERCALGEGEVDTAAVGDRPDGVEHQVALDVQAAWGLAPDPCVRHVVDLVVGHRCIRGVFEKDGRFVYYSVAEPHLGSIMSCVEARFGKGK